MFIHNRGKQAVPAGRSLWLTSSSVLEDVAVAELITPKPVLNNIIT